MKGCGMQNVVFNWMQSSVVTVMIGTKQLQNNHGKQTHQLNHVFLVTECIARKNGNVTKIIMTMPFTLLKSA